MCVGAGIQQEEKPVAPSFCNLSDPFTPLQRNHQNLLRVLMYILSVHIVPLLATLIVSLSTVNSSLCSLAIVTL